MQEAVVYIVFSVVGPSEINYRQSILLARDIIPTSRTIALKEGPTFIHRKLYTENGAQIVWPEIHRLENDVFKQIGSKSPHHLPE